MAGRRHGSGPGFALIQESIRLLLVAQDKARNSASMAGAVYAITNSGASLEGSAEFGTPVVGDPGDEGQAVNDEISSFATALDAFCTTHAGVIAQYNPG